MTRNRLAALLGLLFVALALPSSILVYQAYGQLKWEAFYQHQRLARDLAQRIDADFRGLIQREEQRPISDYEFLNVAGGERDGFLQRSPLSNLPPTVELPGLLGFFQVDAAGRLRTPLVPDTAEPGFGISALELGERRARESRIRGILDRNRLVERDETAPSAETAIAESPLPADADRRNIDFYEVLPPKQVEEEAPSLFSRLESAAGIQSGSDSKKLGQSAFDELIEREPGVPASSAPAEQVSDLELEDTYRIAEFEVLGEGKSERQQDYGKRSRKEKVNLPRAIDDNRERSSGLAADADDAPAETGLLLQQQVRIETFESEVEPMTFALLDSGHFVLFRRVWHRDERYVQGILFEQQPFVDALVEPAFRQSTLASMSRLIVAYRGGILRKLEPEYGQRYQPGGDNGDELLYQSRLIAPFGDVELIFTLARLPLGAGGQVIVWSALVLALVLVGGFVLLYQLGLRQLTLARQQQDFVSAVSHELKTPLTSIRMYGEMLREGWADEAKRKTYYDFIFHEAERLTRLINNVLQLARMSRNEQGPSLRETSVADVLAELRPRLQSQLDPTGFELVVDGDASADAARINIDDDGFVQIFTNLVDNAVKFSASSDIREVHFSYARLADGRIRFAVRDFGPGIAAGQMKKIFSLFYRAENELTRETVGTGIGLALVHQLANTMDAEIDVVNRNPGAEFQLTFPSLKATD